MTWNYLVGQEQRGPITEADFAALVRSGTITDETYVWREGMPEWLPYGQVRNPGSAPGAVPPPISPGGQVVCVECGGIFAPDQVIRHGNAAICAACKPIFLQKLREGVSVTGGMNYAGFWIRAGAKFLDGIIVGIFSIPLSYAIRGSLTAPPTNIPRMVFSNLVGVILAMCYYTFFVGKYGATPGKMAAKLMVVNADGSKVSYAKALGRYFAADWVSGCFTLCIGYMMAGWDDEKRALHDRMCSTRVIKK